MLISSMVYTDETLSMQCALHADAPFVSQPMLKKGQAVGMSQIAASDAFKLEIMKPPGLRPVKQVEIYKKFRHLSPMQCWEETCPNPSDEVLTQVKDDTA
jgi:hypothetical protein